jgi:NAD(P)-dependent dehydrogenase (short-subunit alcohol dehydrogenase family)
VKKLFDLSGHVALITGGGQNVGAGIAHALAAQGAVVAVNDFHADRAERIVAEIEELGGRAIAVPFDVTNLAAVSAGFDAVADRVGPVDILVNNAGTGGPITPLQVQKFADMDPDQWDPVIAVNMLGPMNCAKTAIGSMIERQWGRVITVSSGAGEIGMNLGVSHYGAAKAGAIGFMRHLAIENAEYGVTANTISLGLVLDDPGIVEALAQTIPVKRMGTPADVGALAVYLASEEASWMTGQTIGLNGGGVTR